MLTWQSVVQWPPAAVVFPRRPPVHCPETHDRQWLSSHLATRTSLDQDRHLQRLCPLFYSHDSYKVSQVYSGRPQRTDFEGLQQDDGSQPSYIGWTPAASTTA